jgi:hypothetical protein
MGEASCTSWASAAELCGKKSISENVQSAASSWRNVASEPSTPTRKARACAFLKSRQAYCKRSVVLK